MSHHFRTCGVTLKADHVSTVLRSLNSRFHIVIFNPVDGEVDASRLHPDEQAIAQCLEEIGVLGTEKQEFKGEFERSPTNSHC